MPRREQPPERITGIKIPDENARDWIEVFRNAGFSNEQIDDIMSRLNDTYLKERFNGFIEQELSTVVAVLESDGRTVVDEEHRNRLREEVVKFIQGMDFREFQKLLDAQQHGE